MSELKKVLMERDRLTSDEADQWIAEMRAAVDDGADPVEVLLDQAGLEDDYVEDLLD